ncbi:hypothetical protein AMTRI_Chr01g133700 [Amborella trichopoda]
MRKTGRDLPFRIDGPFSDVSKVLLGGLNELDRKVRQILVGSFCPLLDDTFVLSLGKGRAAFVLHSVQDVAWACKESFYRVRGSLMTLLEWKGLTWVCLWGVPVHIWSESVFKEIVNSFGEYRAVDLKVQISRFLGVPCPRHIRLQVGHDLFLINVCLESNCTTTDNFHKSDQMAKPCELQSSEEEWAKVRKGLRNRFR